MKKKIIAIIASSLGVVLVSALIAAGALMLIREEKVEETGNVLGVTWYSEDEKEFVIDTVDELMEFAALSDFYTFKKQTIKLGADLVLNEGDAKEWEKNAPANRWAPISKFEGTFDGQNHTISGLYAKSYEAPIALFSETTRNAKIQNLSLVNSYLESGGTSGVASFVAKGDGKLTGLYSDAIIVCKGKNSGGIMAVSQTDVTLSECQFAGTIRSTGRIVGGILASQLNGRVNMQHCLFTGDVSTTQKWISWASTDGPEIGGLLGSVNANANVRANDCYSAGKVSTEFLTYSGAVVGLVYTASAGTIMDNTYTTFNLAGKTPIGDGAHNATSSPLELPLELMTGANAYKWTNLDFDNYWGVAEGETPVLRRFAKDTAFLDLSGVEKAFDTSWYDAEGYSFTINNLKQLYGFAMLSQTTDFAEKTVKLGADIKVNDGKATDWYNGKNLPSNPWFTIGTSGTQFAGIFDGQGHTISGVYLKRNTNHTGVFGSTAQPSTVKNLKVTNTFIDASGNKDVRFVGGVFGVVRGNVDTIYSDAIVKSDGYDCGGLIGYSEYSDKSWASVQTINNCQFDGLVTGDTLYRAGGIIGNATYSSGGLDCRVLIKNCLNTGTVQSKVKNYDQINSGMYIGGIVGFEWGKMTITFEDCINVGTLDLDYKTYASAFVGRGSGNAVVTFKNCYATKESASFAGAPVTYGGFSGANTYGDVLVLDEERLSGVTAYQYTLLDFDKYWGAVKDSTPQLRSFGKNFLNTSKVKKMLDVSWYDETKTSFTINTREELYGFYQVALTNTMEGKTFKLGKDIDMNPGWVASGSAEPEVLFFSINKFAGTFDGNNKVIKGIYIQDGAKDGIGLFGQVLEGGKIKNVILDNSLIQSTGDGNNYNGTGWYTGAIVGLLKGTMDSCYVSPNVTVKSNKSAIGGLVGMFNSEDGQIRNSWSEATVEAYYAAEGDAFGGRLIGGIVGYIKSAPQDKAAIKDCLYTGDIYSPDFIAGGLIGQISAAGVKIQDVVSNGTIYAGHGGRLGVIAAYLTGETGSLIMENVYSATRLTNMDGSSDKVDNMQCETQRPIEDRVTGAYTPLTKAELRGKKAYENTNLNFWSSKNAKGTWVAVKGGSVKLKSFLSNANAIADFSDAVKADYSWYEKVIKANPGVENLTFEIDNVSQLVAFAKIVNGGTDLFAGDTVKLTQPLYDLNPGWTLGEELPEDGTIWTPVGIKNPSRFDGTFTGEYEPGKAATIRGMYIDHKLQNAGFFGELCGTAQNLIFENSYIHATDILVGTVAGRLSLGDIKNIYVKDDVLVDAEVGYAGGIVGRTSIDKNNRSGKISGSWFAGKVKGTQRVGGIIGQIWYKPSDSLVLENCLFTGTVEAIEPAERPEGYKLCVGALIGDCDDAIIAKGCLINGKVLTDNTDPSGVGIAVGLGSAGFTDNNVYTTGPAYKLDGTTVNDAANRVGCVQIIKYTGENAYKNTMLDFWHKENESGAWVAIEGAAPELKLFSTSNKIIDKFAPADDKWYTSKLNPDGTIPANTTFDIATTAELIAFGRLVDSGVTFEGSTVQLVSQEYDLNPGWDASTKTAPTGDNAIIWDPIGSTSNQFKGTFDGKMNTIKGVYIYSENTDGVGFFARVASTGVVKNLKLDNSYVQSKGRNKEATDYNSGGWYTGAIVGLLNGTVESCYTSPNVFVTSNKSAIGGLVGMFDSSEGNISNCWSESTVIAYYAESNDQAGGRLLGGLVGYVKTVPQDKATINNCLYTGDIYSADFIAGGLIGQISGAGVRIQNSISNGTIYAGHGGRLGVVCGYITSASGSIILDNVYSTTRLTDMAGNANKQDRMECTSEVAIADRITGAYVPLTKAQLEGKKAYENTALDFWSAQNTDGIWAAIESGTPELKKFTTATDIVDDFSGLQGPERPADPITPTDAWFTSKLQGGAVVPGTVFEIATASDLLALPDIVNNQKFTFEGCTIKLTSEVYDLNPGWEVGQPLPQNGNRWTPVGIHHTKPCFKGTFTGEYAPGKSATIKGIYMSYTGENASGFFGELFGSVTNLKFENSYLYSPKIMLGTVAGRLSLGNISNIYVSETVLVEGTAGVAGGIIGRTSEGASNLAGLTSKCWFDGTVTGKEKLGGIIGQVFYSPSGKVLLDNCLFTGKVKGTGKEIGGLVGQNWDTSIVKNCVSNGLVCSDATTHLGPVVGASTYAITGENTYALNKVYKYDGVTENTISNTDAYDAKTAAQLKACEGVSLDFWSATNTNGVWVATENGPELKMFAAVPTLTSEPQQPNLLRRISTFLASIF